MMTANEESVSISEGQGDDLQAINGIGPRFAKALHQIGIYRYAELAENTAEQLSSDMATTAGIRVAPERIEAADWIGQARKLAGSERTAAVVTGNEPAPAMAVQNQVHQHAEFSLFFDYVILETGQQEWQTRLYHAESGREALLTGTDVASWTSWILKHAKLPTSDELPVDDAEEAVTPERSVHPYNVKLKISDVEVGSDDAGEQYDVAVHFTLAGPDADLVAGERIPYAVEVQTIDLAAGAIDQFVESGQLHLQPDQVEYTVRHTLPMPKRGRYELHTVVYVDAPAEMSAYHTGPTLNIV